MFIGYAAPFIPLDHSEALAGLGPLVFRVCKIEPSLRQREREGLLGTSSRQDASLTASIAYFRYSSCFAIRTVHQVVAIP